MVLVAVVVAVVVVFLVVVGALVAGCGMCCLTCIGLLVERCKHVCDGLTMCFCVATVVNHACDYVFVFAALDAAYLFEVTELLYDVIDLGSALSSFNCFSFFLYCFADYLSLVC